MKYIKLFESFNRYDFGEYYEDVIGEDAMKELFDYIEIESIEIDDDIRKKLIDELSNTSSVSEYMDNTYEFVIYVYSSDSDEYHIYDLGDYCYAVVKNNDWGCNLFIGIFDDIDPLILKLKEILG